MRDWCGKWKMQHFRLGNDFGKECQMHWKCGGLNVRMWARSLPLLTLSGEIILRFGPGLIA